MPPSARLGVKDSSFYLALYRWFLTRTSLVYRICPTLAIQPLAPSQRPCYNRGVRQRLGSLAGTLARVPTAVWVVVLILPALVPLARGGFPESIDGLFHIYRLVGLDHAVRSGVLLPRWFPEFAFGYGHPVLNFYGPLSYYWGLPFTLLGADAILAMKLVLASGLIASGLAMYLFARLYLDRGPALVAAVVYAYLPYHLVDLYVRGAVAEFLAFVWFPLILWAFHHLINDSGGRRLIWLAVASLTLAALVTTHSLSALIFAPVLAGFALFLLWKQHDWHPLGRVATALILAAGLSAFYWLPVLTESGFVGLGYGASQGYRNHFIPLREVISIRPVYSYSPQPDVPSTFPVGWVQALILGAALVLPFRMRRGRWLVLFFLAVALFSSFMLTTVSLPIWKVLEPGLAFLQYPWRFQALIALGAGFLAGAILAGLTSSSGPRRAALGALIVLATGVWALWSLPVKPTYPELSVQAMWQTDRENGQVGATWTGEYLPIWVKEQRWAISLSAPNPTPADSSGSADLGTFLPGTAQLTGTGYTRYDFTLEASQETSLALHQFYYPGWQARWQGKTIAAHPQGVLGLATFDLPPGSGPLVLRLAPTPAQLWGTLVSFVAALALGVALAAQLLLRRPGSTRRLLPRHEWALSAALAVCCLLLAAVFFTSLVRPNGHVQSTQPINANLDNLVELQTSTLDGNHYRPGDTVEITVYWMALDELQQDYRSFVHLTDAAVTRQPAQHDGDPGGGFTPTTRWLPGELVPDTHYLILPDDLPSGRYSVWAGMYEYPSLDNLTILSADAPTDGRRVLVAQIEVVAP